MARAVCAGVNHGAGFRNRLSRRACGSHPLLASAGLNGRGRYRRGLLGARHHCSGCQQRQADALGLFHKPQFRVENIMGLICNPEEFCRRAEFRRQRRVPIPPSFSGVLRRTRSGIYTRLMECKEHARLSEVYFETFGRQQWIAERLKEAHLTGDPQAIRAAEAQNHAALEELYDQWQAMNTHSCSECKDG